MSTLVDLSRKDWDWADFNGPASYEAINVGSLQRIAAATELMAANYVKLQNELAYYQRRLEEEKKCSQRLARRNAALAGVITRMRKKQDQP